MDLTFQGCSFHVSSTVCSTIVALLPCDHKADWDRVSYCRSLVWSKIKTKIQSTTSSKYQSLLNYNKVEKPLVELPEV